VDCEKIEWLVGTEYRDRIDKPARGLTYSDMAILVRAWKDAGPIVEALREAEVPYLGGGMNSLLNTPEAQAVRDMFYFLASHIPRGRAAVRNVHGDAVVVGRALVCRPSSDLIVAGGNTFFPVRLPSELPCGTTPGE
jgi:superfamily I DNA/RNA helicase